MRVLVCGSRGFGVKDHDLTQMDLVLRKLPKDATIVHGDAWGADKLAGQWARLNGRTEETHPADWNTHGRAAGPIRNQKMLDTGINYAVAFWDGSSRGTKDMIERLKKAGVHVEIIIYGAKPCSTSPQAPREKP